MSKSITIKHHWYIFIHIYDTYTAHFILNLIFYFFFFYFILHRIIFTFTFKTIFDLSLYKNLSFDKYVFFNSSLNFYLLYFCVLADTSKSEIKQKIYTLFVSQSFCKREIRIAALRRMAMHRQLAFSKGAVTPPSIPPLLVTDSTLVGTPVEGLERSMQCFHRNQTRCPPPLPTVHSTVGCSLRFKTYRCFPSNSSHLLE